MKEPEFDSERLIAILFVAVCAAFIAGYLAGTAMTQLSGGPP